MYQPAPTPVASLGACVLAVLAAGCHRAPHQPTGRIVVALTIDWEGAYLSNDGLDALEDVRFKVGDAPFTHFMSAGYFTKEHPDPQLVRTLVESVHKGDELAVHLHGWKSLAKA